MNRMVRAERQFGRAVAFGAMSAMAPAYCGAPVIMQRAPVYIAPRVVVQQPRVVVQRTVVRQPQ